MKLILSGSTGFVGSHVLQTCLAHPSITSIVTLTRRPLPSSVTSMPSAAGKLHPIILEDFLIYPASVVEQLQGASACVWCLGDGLKGDRSVNLEYTMAAARKFQEEVRVEGGVFRFVYTSGMMAVRDQGASLWVMGSARKMRGEVENQLLTLAAQYPSSFAAFIGRPGSVLKPDSPVPRQMDGYTMAIRVDALAAALVKFAVEGCDENVVDNADLRRRGNEALEEMKGRIG